MTTAEALRKAADEVLSAVEKYDQGRMRSDRDRWLGAMGAAERMHQEASRLEALEAKAAELTEADFFMIGSAHWDCAQVTEESTGRKLVEFLEERGFTITRKARAGAWPREEQVVVVTRKP